jgi:two-component system, OmpR family, sensor histidine kinase MtrB
MTREARAISPLCEEPAIASNATDLGLPAPRRFRRRLTIAFVFSAVVTGSVLALSCYVIVRSYRLNSFDEHAQREARLALIAAPRDLSATSFERLLREYEERGGFDAIATSGGVEFSSNPALRAADIPASIRQPPVAGISRPVRATVGHRHYTVVSGGVPGGDVHISFFFQRDALLASLRDMRNVLGLGWLVTVLGAALFGRTVARRTLRPVAGVAVASCMLTERLTGTRLELPDDDEFATLTVAFNEMAVAVSDKINRLRAMADRERRFTADVAHDLRTPLTSMTSLATVFEERLDELPPDMRRGVELLTESIGRMRRLVLELLELARIEAREEAIELVPIPVRQELQRLLDEHAVDAPLDVEAGLGALAERTCFRRVVANLIENAQRHAGGVARVHAFSRGAQCIIEIDDHGPGVPPGELDAIFHRFHKTDRSRSSQGSGLGLAIARNFAGLQHGTVRAANRTDGARFIFTLALASTGTGALSSTIATGGDGPTFAPDVAAIGARPVTAPPRP